VAESVGEVSSYGDQSMNGLSDALFNWEPRQSYHYQTFTKWGDKELAKAGLAKIDMAAEKNVSSAIVMTKFQNKSYFFGVGGLDNYGLLNEPSLSAPISPSAGAWKSATGIEIYQDILNLFVQLQSQLLGNIEMEDELIMALPPTVQPYLLTSMQYVYGAPTVKAMLKEGFPKLTIMTAAEYATASGNLVQLIAPKIAGQRTAFCGFTEKMRAHAIVRDTSYTYQKKSGGTWGIVLKIPAGISQLLGV
jgi:hypothetical protein